MRMWKRSKNYYKKSYYMYIIEKNKNILEWSIIISIYSITMLTKHCLHESFCIFFYKEKKVTRWIFLCSLHSILCSYRMFLNMNLYMILILIHSLPVSFSFFNFILVFPYMNKRVLIKSQTVFFSVFSVYCFYV